MSDSLVVEWKNWKKCITIFHSGSSDHTKLQNTLRTIIFQLFLWKLKTKYQVRKKVWKASFHLKTDQHKYGYWLINYHVSEIHHILGNGGFKSGKFPVPKENRPRNIQGYKSTYNTYRDGILLWNHGPKKFLNEGSFYIR